MSASNEKTEGGKTENPVIEASIKLCHLGQNIEKTVNADKSRLHGHIKFDFVRSGAVDGRIECIFSRSSIDRRGDGPASFIFIIRKNEGSLEIRVNEGGESVTLTYQDVPFSFSNERGIPVLQKLISEMETSFKLYQEKSARCVEEQKKEINDALLAKLEKF